MKLNIHYRSGQSILRIDRTATLGMHHTRPVQTTGATPKCICHWLSPAHVISHRLGGVHTPKALHGTNDPCRRSPSTLPSTLPTALYALQFKSASGFPKVSSKGPKHNPIFLSPFIYALLEHHVASFEPLFLSDRSRLLGQWPGA